VERGKVGMEDTWGQSDFGGWKRLHWEKFRGREREEAGEYSELGSKE